MLHHRVGHLGGAAVALAILLAVPQAGAADLHRKFLLGFRVGDFLSADEQKGGFRAFGSVLESGDRAVKLREVPTGSISLAYGVKKLGKTEMILELQASRVSTTLRAETVYQDPDASTRIVLWPAPTPGQNGDERFFRMPVGDVTLTPIFVNALFQWGSGRHRADFYAGGGPGVVLATIDEDPEFREFKKDYDGTDDVNADNAFGIMVKAGSNIRLSSSGSWLLYVEGEFYSTGLLTSEAQATWSGSDFFAGTQDIDTDGDNVDDTFGIEADLRIIDRGKVRLDGATIGIGLRYRFGARQRATAPTTTDDGTVSGEVPAEPVP